MITPFNIDCFSVWELLGEGLLPHGLRSVLFSVFALSVKPGV